MSREFFRVWKSSSTSATNSDSFHRPFQGVSYFGVFSILPATEAPLFRLLLGARSLPRIAAGRKAPQIRNSEPIFGWATRVGFALLAEQADRELVLGWVGQFWKLVGGFSPRITNPQEFLGFDRPEYAKATLNFCLAELSDDTCVRLTTETRVYATNPVAYRKFAVYWRLIRGGSALVRREWLKAIRRRAEAQ